MTPQRRRLLHALADAVPAPGVPEGSGEPDGVRVAVDGVDGAGKSTLVDELAEQLRARGRPVVRVSADDFHHPRAIRYRRGRSSAQGFFLDSYDLEALRGNVLEPFGPAGDRRYRAAVHDVGTDEPVDAPPQQAPPGAVLVLDGLFLLRDELADCFELTVFVDVPFEVTFARMARRDGCDPDPAHPENQRYVGGQRLYLVRADPRARADLVVDNADPSAPSIVRRRHA